MKLTRKLGLALLAFMLGLTGNSMAQLAGMTRQSQNGVVFVSGGVGEDQQQALRIMRDEYNLQLTFAAKDSGAYLANVHITIQSASGINFVDTVSEGPILLAKLALGDYLITAKYGDVAQSKMIFIDKYGLKQLGFYW